MASDVHKNTDTKVETVSANSVCRQLPQKTAEQGLAAAVAFAEEVQWSLAIRRTISGVGFGEALKLLMNDRDMTVEQMESESGLSVSTVKRLRAGQDASVEQIVAISVALHLPPPVSGDLLRMCGITLDFNNQKNTVYQAAIQAAQDALTAAQNKLEEIEQENKKAENDCSNLFTWASTYQNASFQQRQTILNQFIKEVRVGRDYDIEIILNVPLEEFEEFKSHSLSVRTPSGRKTDLKQAPVRGLGTPNGGIVVFDKTSGEAMNIMPKSSAHVTLRCQDE